MIVEVVDCKTASWLEHLAGTNPTCATHGEVDKEMFQDKMKLSDCGMTHMMIGCPKDHTSNCYHMLDKDTVSAPVTVDVTWLHWMYFALATTGYEVISNQNLDMVIPSAVNVSEG